MGHGAAAGWQGRDTEQASSSECSGASGSGDNGEEGGWSCDEAYPVPLSQVGNGGHSRHGAGARGHLGMQQAGMQWQAGHHQGYHGYDGHVAAAGHAHGHALGASRHAPPGLWPGQGGGHGLPQFHP